MSAKGTTGGGRLELQLEERESCLGERRERCHCIAEGLLSLLLDVIASVDGRRWCLPIEPAEAGDRDKLTDIDLKQKLRQLDVAVGLSSCEWRGYRCWGDSFAGVEEEGKGNF